MSDQKVRQQQHILLTTPHETCLDNDSKTDHTCDTASLPFAIELLKQLKENFQTHLIRASTNRTIIDFNRKESRQTDFRKAIRKELQMSIQTLVHDPIYLFDCHSFPGGDQTFKSKTILEPEVALLFPDSSLRFIFDELAETLNKKQIPTTVLQGANNDIVNETHDANFQPNTSTILIIAVLVEVSESLSKEKLSTIAETIKDWIGGVNQLFTL